MGEALGLKGISAMVVGGMGNIWGAIAGGIVIGLAEVLSIDLFGADFVDISVYGLLAADSDCAADRPVRRGRRGSARMSGYLEGILVLLAINIVFAYGAFLPIAAGQLNLGVAGFAAIGGYASAYLSNNAAISALVAIPLGGLAAGVVALAVAVPVLRTRGIYLALATFALGEIVRASILNLEVVGGAAGYPVVAFIRLPTIAAFALGVAVFVWLLFATRFGIAITAVHDDERVADLMGLNVRAFQVAAFVLGCGHRRDRRRALCPSFQLRRSAVFRDFAVSISIVLYVLFGGTQSVLGPLLGAAVFTLLPEILRGSAQWRYVLFAAIVIVVMVVRPQGLVTGASVGRLLGFLRNPAGDPRRDRDGKEQAA